MTAEQQDSDESGEGLSEAEALRADLAHEREHNAYLQAELDADAKHAALAEGETCDVCTHLESEQVQRWMTADLDWQDRAESAEAALATARRDADELHITARDLADECNQLRGRLAAVEALANQPCPTSGRHSVGPCSCELIDPADLRAALANPSAAQGEAEVPR